MPKATKAKSLKIENRIKKTDLIKWRELEWFQPAKLKTMSKDQASKLTASIANNHFMQPFNVWQKGKKLLILDGHHREMVMRAMEQGGYQFPDLLPANFIDIKSEEEAKKAVLIYNAHYANIVQSELELFIEGLDLDELAAQIELPELNFAKIDQINELEHWKGMPGFESKEDTLKIVVHFMDDAARKEFAAKHKLKFVKMQANAWSTTYPYQERDDLISLKYE